jgi:4'-phosphopantetheinyl transferase
MRPFASRLGTIRAPTAGNADIWFARIGDHAADVDRFGKDHLSAQERGRLEAYKDQAAAERYVVTRALVRCVLGEEIGIAPRDVPISLTESGKPILPNRIHFNVSHSGDLVVLAVSREREVGIDLERRRGVPRADALIERWLTLEEREDVGRQIANGADISEAFLRVWSFKEARLKALGVGISGASGASFRAVDAVALDDLLEQITTPGDAGYVGALAFA